MRLIINNSPTATHLLQPVWPHCDQSEPAATSSQSNETRRRRGRSSSTAHRQHQTRMTQRHHSNPPVALLSLVLLCVVVVSCNFILNTQAAAAAPSSPVSNDRRPHNKLPALSERSGPSSESSDSQDDLDSASSDLVPSATSGSSATSNSIVASLSSAVASAAAAAAVAAAHNGLSGGDARSGSSVGATGSGPAPLNSAHQTGRSTGLNFALKIADSIPEVPYSILHNMKKVDHAAPFYNTPGKIHIGLPSGKGESNYARISSALTSASGVGSLSSTVESLGSLFRSPLWKRIADGYGEFTSEFRSLFRGSSGAANPMKGPVTSSSASKLLRDISVPAFLVLLASAMPAEWRPHVSKNRRKAFAPIDLPQAAASNMADQLAAAATSATSGLEMNPSYSIMPQQQHHQQAPIGSDYSQFNYQSAPRNEPMPDGNQNNGPAWPTSYANVYPPMQSPNQQQQQIQPQPQPQLQPQQATQVDLGQQQAPVSMRRMAGEPDGGDLSFTYSFNEPKQQLREVVHSAPFGDKTINYKEYTLFNNRRQQPEQRDLTQMLPQTWKDAVKRTVNSVQQTASNQWKSIEGPLATWVQDKISKAIPAKAGPTSTTATANATSSSSSSPVSNIIATVGSKAMDILGLQFKPRTAASSNQQQQVHQSTSSADQSTGKDLQSAASNDSSPSSSLSSSSSSSGSMNASGKSTANKATLADMIVNTLASSSSSQKSAPAIQAANGGS